MDNKILMKDLLDKFSESDSFSLTGSILGIAITNEVKNNSLEEIKSKTRKYLLEHYERLKEQMPNISFDDLYQEIELECLNFGINQKKFYMEKYGFFNNSFICDYVMKERDGIRTKYTEPMGYFWHFYHRVGQNFDREEYLDELMKKDNKLEPVDRIEDEILKSNLIRYEILFHNHCTESGSLMINYYFKLNDDTRKWLLQFESDFDLECNLEDLAFYKNGELMFSSCTHEEFNSIMENY